MLFIPEFESSKNQEGYHSLFLNISSSPRVIKFYRRVVSDQKVIKTAVKINQNQ